MDPQAEQLRTVLSERYPMTFTPKGQEKKPLKVGIREDIVSDMPEVDPKMVSRALGSYVGGPTYLRNMRLGEPRIALDGSPVGVVEEKDVNFAHMKLRHLQKKWNKRRRSAEAKKRGT